MRKTLQRARRHTGRVAGRVLHLVDGAGEVGEERRQQRVAVADQPGAERHHLRPPVCRQELQGVGGEREQARLARSPCTLQPDDDPVARGAVDQRSGKPPRQIREAEHVAPSGLKRAIAGDSAVYIRLVAHAARRSCDAGPIWKTRCWLRR